MALIETQQEESIDAATDPVVLAADTISIECQNDFEIAGDFLTERLKPVQKLVTETFGPILKATHAAHKEAVAQKKIKMAPLEEAEGIVKEKIVDFLDAHDALVAKTRRDAEATANDMEARGESPSAIEDALSAIISGGPGLGDPEAPGVSSHVRWGAEVTDFKALVQAVAAGQVPLDVIQPNAKRLNDMATALTEMLSVPGVKAVKKRVVSATAR